MVVLKVEEEGKEERGIRRARKACEGPSKTRLSHKFPGLGGGFRQLEQGCRSRYAL